VLGDKGLIAWDSDDEDDDEDEESGDEAAEDEIRTDAALLMFAETLQRAHNTAAATERERDEKRKRPKHLLMPTKEG
jgi:hypothetical protein